MIRKKRWRAAIIVTAIAFSLVFFVYIGYGALQKALYPIKYEAEVTQYAAENGLPPSLVYAVIHTESHFKAEAVSSAGAKGLMQLMDDTFTWVQTRLEGDEDTLDEVLQPAVNIRAGCKLLAIVLEQFDNVETALAAYNAGSGNVSRWLADEAYSDDGVTLKVIPFTETENYVRRVLKAQELYKTIYAEEGLL